MSSQTDISEICGDIQANGKYCGSHAGRIKALLEHFAKAKIPLATIADDRHMGRHPDTIKRYCRENAISLVDYTPMFMRDLKAK